MCSMSFDVAQYATGPAFDPERLARSWEAVRRAETPGPAQRMLTPWQDVLVHQEQARIWASALLFDIDDPIAFASMDRVKRRVLAYGF